MKKIFTLVAASFFFFENVNAYIGIGPLIPLIGSAILYIFLGIVTILGFVVYPIKKIQSYIKAKYKLQFKHLSIR